MKESRPEKRCYTCTWWKPLTKKCTCEQAEKRDEVTDQMWYCVMSGQESRGSVGEYQADEQAGVARLSWRVSGR